jgi:ABC-type polysaccharide/polyol phosphate transport system ATPase subunit
MTTVVRFEDVSVRFYLRHQRPRSLQDAVVNVFRRQRDTSEEFWALRNISLDVHEGETLGIIGQNGSGKSTLLKLITRILEPTSGAVTVNGKVSALIELGAGFHPDLTGRENIYLNGSILGYGRKHMNRLFDEIVAFSELERFIDTPVKHYSSGMYARLGFAVAISVDPEILIIDEVLSVGDEGFQRKCLTRIDDFRKRQKTIIIVSHDLSVIGNICDRAVWLQNGFVQTKGPSGQVVERYAAELEPEANHTTVRASRIDDITSAAKPIAPVPENRAPAAIVDLACLSDEGTPRRAFRTGDKMVARLHYRVDVGVTDLTFRISFRRADGLLLFSSSNKHRVFEDKELGPARVVAIVFDNVAVLPGAYELAAKIESIDDSTCWHDDGERVANVTVWSELVDEGIVALPTTWLSSSNSVEFVGSSTKVGE